ncbi:MAG: Nif3-like dinuclear metal center hexameric protein [Vampirovibrionia bacterium]
MSEKIKDVAAFIEELAPLNTAEVWDNCGWQVLCGDVEVKKVLVCLSVTNEVVDKAIAEGYEVIVSHHPIIFKGIKSVMPINLTGQVVLKAIKNDISIYSAHTNLDKVEGGINDLLAKMLNLKDVEPIIPEKYNNKIGMGRIGVLDTPVKIEDLVSDLKQKLELDTLKVINMSEVEIKKVAICGGAGASLIEYLPLDVDLFITGDVKYHEALETLNFVLIDANHNNTEQIIVDKLKSYLSNLDIEVESVKSGNPWLVM